MIVGALVTHNTLREDLDRAVESLRSVSDKVIAFDDGSTNGTRQRLYMMVDGVMSSDVAAPELLALRRSMLYSEAERLGADWFVYHDDDEALSPTIRSDLRSFLGGLADSVRSVAASAIHLYGDEQHFLAHDGSKVYDESIAWRANRGWTYYNQLRDILVGSRATPKNRWHCFRHPVDAESERERMPFPRYALVHYGMSSPERISDRRAWSEKTGLLNHMDGLDYAKNSLPINGVPEWETP